MRNLVLTVCLGLGSMAVANPTTAPATRPAGAQAIGQIDDQLLQEHLLKGAGPEDDITRSVRRIDACMGRSRDRLARETDPGQTTQLIQEQIVKDLDELIALVRKASPPPSPSTQPSKADPKDPLASKGEKPENSGKQPGPPQPNRGNTPATAERLMAGPGGATGDMFNSEAAAKMWGRISPRLPGAVIDVADEQVVEKYAQYIRRYYQGVATRATER